jgi:hypothetical protein
MGIRQTTKSFLKNYKVSVPVGVVLVGFLSWLAFGFFAVHLLFVDDKVSEEVPSAVSAVEPATEASGTFSSDAHPTSGTALVLAGSGTAQRFLRFQDFKTDNGPDLNVYLVNSGAGGVDDRVDLGDLKGNIGNQNYELPAGTDVTKYDTVVIWCVRFSVAFGRAALTET